jgi:hypothetical protein
MQIDMSAIKTIIAKAIAEHNQINSDYDRMIAKAKFSVNMRWPRPKARLSVIEGGKR